MLDVQNTKITHDAGLDVESMFKNARSASPAVAKSDSPAQSVVVKTPLQQMMEKQQMGLGTPIVNNNDDGPKRGGSLTDERVESANQAIHDMDELAKKASMVSITKKPTSDLELAELMENLDNLDLGDLESARAKEDNSENAVTDVIGEEVNPNTVVKSETGDNKIDNSGLFVARWTVPEHLKEKQAIPAEMQEVKPADTVSVHINKESEKVGDTSVIEFTEEEREKLVHARQIELVQVNKININTGRVVRPDENFMKEYTTSPRKAIGTSAQMTFVASRFRATMRGLTFGEYLDLALSTEITDVEILNKKLSVFYNTIVNTSIGPFTSYEEFLRNFAFKDLTFGTYCLYIATNPESVELGLKCGVDTCKKNFTVSFSPRNLLVLDSLSERFLEIMETTGKLDGVEAMKYHNESSIISKQVIELPGSEIGIEVGLRSCYDMIHIVLPFINSVETLMAEKHPDDLNRIHEVISYTTNYISAIYFKDESGEYTIREDNIENIVEVIYNLPMGDYEIISAIMSQTDEDYYSEFGVQKVVCPACGNETVVVKVDIDEEVFRQFQELGSTRIDRKSLPRL